MTERDLARTWLILAVAVAVAVGLSVLWARTLPREVSAGASALSGIVVGVCAVTALVRWR